MPAGQTRNLNEIRRGDLIGTENSGVIGLVYAPVYEDNKVHGFKIIPIRVFESGYKGQNTEKTMMLPNAWKSDCGLDTLRQYQVDFYIKNAWENPLFDDHIIPYHGRCIHLDMGAQLLSRMETILNNDREDAILDTRDNIVYTFHKAPPTHVIEAQKPSAVMQLDIQLNDAANRAHLLPGIITTILTSGANGDQPLRFLREAYRMATSETASQSARFERLIKSGIRNSDILIRDAEVAGIINPPGDAKEWKKAGFTTLSTAYKAIRHSPQDLDDIDTECVYRIQQGLTENIRQKLTEAWEDLLVMYTDKQSSLHTKKIPHMYPKNG